MIQERALPVGRGEAASVDIPTNPRKRSRGIEFGGDWALHSHFGSWMFSCELLSPDPSACAYIEDFEWLGDRCQGEFAVQEQ